MSALIEIWHTIQALCLSADYTTLAVAAVIIVAAGIIIEGPRSAVAAALGALIVFALVKFGLVVVLGKHVDPEGILAADWRAFADMKTIVFLSYVIIFGVLIGVVSAIRSAFR